MVLRCNQAFRTSQQKPQLDGKGRTWLRAYVSSRRCHARASPPKTQAAGLNDSTAGVEASAVAKTVAPAGDATRPASWVRPDARAAAPAAAFGFSALSAVTYQALSGTDLPPIEALVQAVPEVLGAAVVTTAAALVLAKAVLKDKFHIELHRGRLYIQAGVPSNGPAVSPNSIITQATGDVRGNGAYATALIPAATHIADYSGELLNRQQFFTKYPDGVGDYAMAIDQEWVIDAADVVAHVASFHPVHMNHSRTRFNVLRYYNRRQGRVAFFAARDIQPGEELLYDYGRAYWRGREHMELP